MQELLEYLFKSLVKAEEKVEVSEIKSEDPGLLAFAVKIPKDEMGKVIGSGGAVIKGVRLLASIKARKDGKKLSLDLIES